MTANKRVILFTYRNNRSGWKCADDHKKNLLGIENIDALVCVYTHICGVKYADKKVRVNGKKFCKKKHF